VAIVSVVVVDAVGVAAEQGDVVGLAGMDLAVELYRVAAFRRQARDVGRTDRIEDLLVVLVLVDDDEDVGEARDALGADAGPLAGAACESLGRNGGGAQGEDGDFGAQAGLHLYPDSARRAASVQANSLF
jgi:alkanesulfonate monooxygenase SsuD/methylene tetrahydromethanopterin reductase-like flavin-dependent oxidoreductase (luciferase family)